MKILKFAALCSLIAIMTLSCTDKGTNSGEDTGKLSVTPTTLNFGTALTALPFVITNKTSDEVSYSIVESCDWLSCNPIDGEINDESDAIIVTVTRPAEDGDYEASVWVRSDADTIEVKINMSVGTTAEANWFGTLSITLNQDWPGDNIFSEYNDIITIMCNFIVSGSEVTGTGAATRYCTVSDGDCTVTGVTAPEFDVGISGTVEDGNLVFYAVPIGAEGTEVIIHLMCDDDPMEVPGMDLLESQVLTLSVEVSVPLQNAAGNGGSGTSNIGEDPEFTYNYSIVIYEN